MVHGIVKRVKKVIKGYKRLFAINSCQSFMSEISLYYGGRFTFRVHYPQMICLENVIGLRFTGKIPKLKP